MVFRIKEEQKDALKGVLFETLKEGVINPSKEQKQRYRAVTGRNYVRVKRASSIYLIEHERGQVFTAIEWKNNGYLNISVHGLQQYNKKGEITEGAIQRKLALIDMLEQLEEFRLIRVDYAIDRSTKIPPRVINKLQTKRYPKLVGTTIYFQPLNQRISENPTLKIMIYDKGKHNKLPYPLYRLEFALKSIFWNKELITIYQVNNIINTKGKAVLERWTGEKVEVQKFIAKYF